MIEDIYAAWEALEERGICGSCHEREHDCLCDTWCEACGALTNHRTSQHTTAMEEGGEA